jgi:hypothetical protein
MYDRDFKERCLREVLSRYRRFLNIPAYPEDKKLVFFLTMCRMLDNASTATDPPSPSPSPSPWNLKALEANQNRLFSRYNFNAQLTEEENFRNFLDELLAPSVDSTVDFI